MKCKYNPVRNILNNQYIYIMVKIEPLKERLFYIYIDFKLILHSDAQGPSRVVLPICVKKIVASWARKTSNSCILIIVT